MRRFRSSLCPWERTLRRAPERRGGANLQPCPQRGIPFRSSGRFASFREGVGPWGKGACSWAIREEGLQGEGKLEQKLQESVALVLASTTLGWGQRNVLGTRRALALGTYPFSNSRTSKFALHTLQRAKSSNTGPSKVWRKGMSAPNLVPGSDAWKKFLGLFGVVCEGFGATLAEERGGFGSGLPGLACGKLRALSSLKTFSLACHQSGSAVLSPPCSLKSLKIISLKLF